jgi:tetratricopeptide (TPR) repeat protein
MAAETYYLLAPYYGELKQDSMVVECFKKAAELNPDNSDYLERLAQVYVNEDNFDGAIAVYERLYTNNKDRSDVLNMLLQLYNQKKDYPRMIETINRIEMTDGSSEKIALSRMNVYEQMGRKKEALNELQQLSKKHPNDLNYRVMIGNWLLQNDRKAEALAEYEHVLKEEPENNMAQMSLLDFYRAEGRDSVVQAMQERMLKSAATPFDTKMVLMRQVVQENESQGGDSTKVLQLFDRILSEPQTDSGMAELHAAYMSLKQMPVDTINKALERVLDIEPDNAAARIQLIQNVWAAKDYDRVVELSSAARQYNPDEMVFYYFCGLAHFLKDDKDEALDAFRRGVGEVNEQSDKGLVSDMYAIMGDILHDRGKATEAYAAYDSCLQWKDDNIGCLNNYAYYLSEENRDLQKAEQMSYRTIKAEPTNSTYLDTYAWILFMQKRYAEAQIYIDQAIQNDSTQSAVILEHGGDIHAMNNDLLLALEYWQKARDAGSESKVLIRKIKLKKYIKE